MLLRLSPRARIPQVVIERAGSTDGDVPPSAVRDRRRARPRRASTACPLLFGPSPVHRLERLSAHLGGAGRDLGQARGLQLRPRLRRQQGAQARVPRRRRARAGLRHARLDRRRAVEPHAAGRRRRRAPRPAAACSSRSTGSTGPTPSTTRSATSCSRGSWAPTSASIRRRLRHRHSAELGARRSRRSRTAGGKPYAIPAGASDHPLGGLGFASWARRGRRSRSASSASSSTRSSSARSPARRRRA